MAKKVHVSGPSPKGKAPKVPKSAKTKPRSAKTTPVEQRSAGRPKGQTNFQPERPLQVRDSGNFKGIYEGPVGPRWVRVYASDQENSLRLLALADLIEAQDPSLIRLLNKQVKAA